MKAKEREYLRHKIDDEGFHYLFAHYSSFKEIKDVEFHRLRKAYLKASEDLMDYIG